MDEPVSAYLFEINDPQSKRKSNTGTLLSILGCIIFVARWKSAAENYYTDLIFAVVIAVGLIYNFTASSYTKFRIPHRFFFFVTAVGLSLFPPFNILSFPYLILTFIERRFSAKPNIEFSEKGITVSGWRKQFYEWNSFQSVILKDDLLTLDFKNNRLLQKEIVSASSIEELSFNNWVARHVGK